MILSLAPLWGPIFIATTFITGFCWVRLILTGQGVREAVVEGIRQVGQAFAARPGRSIVEIPGLLLVLWVCGVGLFCFGGGLYLLFVGPKVAALKDLLGPFWPPFL